MSNKKPQSALPLKYSVCRIGKHGDAMHTASRELRFANKLAEDRPLHAPTHGQDYPMVEPCLLAVRRCHHLDTTEVTARPCIIPRSPQKNSGGGRRQRRRAREPAMPYARQCGVPNLTGLKTSNARYLCDVEESRSIHI